MIKKTSSNSFSKIVDFIKSLYPDEDPVPLHAPRFISNAKKNTLSNIQIRHDPEPIGIVAWILRGHDPI